MGTERTVGAIQATFLHRAAQRLSYKGTLLTPPARWLHVHVEMAFFFWNAVCFINCVDSRRLQSEATATCVFISPHYIYHHAVGVSRINKTWYLVIGDKDLNRVTHSLIDSYFIFFTSIKLYCNVEKLETLTENVVLKPVN